MSGLSEHADSSFYGTGVGVCRGCGTWLKSNENDGYCDLLRPAGQHLHRVEALGRGDRR